MIFYSLTKMNPLTRASIHRIYDAMWQWYMSTGGRVAEIELSVDAIPFLECELGLIRQHDVSDRNLWQYYLSTPAGEIRIKIKVSFIPKRMYEPK